MVAGNDCPFPDNIFWSASFKRLRIPVALLVLSRDNCG